jgi:hypothetical protein
MFPSAISDEPDLAANRFTKSSGVEVPNATIVSPITREGIPNRFESEAEPFTRRSAPFSKKITPNMNKSCSSMKLEGKMFYKNN